MSILVLTVACGGADDSPLINSSSGNSSSSSSSSPAMPTSANWARCADLNGICTFDGTQQVRLGYEGDWVQKSAQTAILCNAQAFDVPNTVAQAYCEVLIAPNQSASSIQLVGAQIDAATGKQVFDEQCASCHSINEPNKRAALGSVINAVISTVHSMPIVNPSSCVGLCAIQAGAYYFNAEPEPTFALQRAPIAPNVLASRAKVLLTGGAITNDELIAIQADPTALFDRVGDWIDHVDSDGSRPFHQKMRPFFNSVFSQGKMNVNDITPQISGNDGLGDFRYIQSPIFENLNDYVVNTLFRYVDNNKPFNQIINTQRWYVTTAVLSFFLASEQHTMPQLTIRSRDCDTSIDQATQIINRDICIPTTQNLRFGPATPKPAAIYRSKNVAGTWPPAIFLSHIADNPKHALFKPSDFNDWRWVEFQISDDESPVPFYDLITLRNSNTLKLRTPRVGFFTSPSFLETWRTNVDNQFRVTVNQTMIVATGSAFEDSDVTIPLSGAGISEEHAAPGTACFSCHQHLDPMRNYFEAYFDNFSGKPLDVFNTMLPKSFSFKGHVGNDDNLKGFANILANHPLVANGWVQKLCFYANSKACIETDPEFIAVVDDFKSNNLNLRYLFQRFFSSPLFTHYLTDEQNPENDSVISISRNQHFCQALSYRLVKYRREIEGVTDYQYDACNDKHRRIFRESPFDVNGGIPGEFWPRGADKPLQPTGANAFYTASLNEFCARVASTRLKFNTLPTGDTNTYSVFLVQHLMGIAPADERYDPLLALFTRHIIDALEISKPKAAYQSAFVLACSSPIFASNDI